jgi:hypothetical protein
VLQIGIFAAHRRLAPSSRMRAACVSSRDLPPHDLSTRSRPVGLRKILFRPQVYDLPDALGRQALPQTYLFVNGPRVKRGDDTHVANFADLRGSAADGGKGHGGAISGVRRSERFLECRILLRRFCVYQNYRILPVRRRPGKAVIAFAVGLAFRRLRLGSGAIMAELDASGEYP